MTAPVLVLDSGAVSRLAPFDRVATVIIGDLRRRGAWPPVVPSVVAVECLTGHVDRDALVNRLLTTCHVPTDLPLAAARRAAHLRFQAGRGSAVDAIVAASAEPGGLVLTGDVEDLTALAAHADGVRVERI